MNNYTVYKHIFPNGKIYIGMTRQDPLRRWDNGRGYRTQTLMSRAINKYGWENVQHEIVASGLSKEQAERMEIDLIAAEKANNPKFGYNDENGGNCAGTHSEATKRKISAAQMGEKNHMYGKPSPVRGKKRTPEQNERNRQAHIGQKSYWKGKKLPTETVEKLRRPKSEEHKKHLSEARSVPVMCVETGIVYKSGKAAAEALGIPRGSIAHVVKGERHTAGGFHWIKAEV